MRLFAVILLCGLAGLGAGASALGQGYPTNPVHTPMTNDLATNPAAANQPPLDPETDEAPRHMTFMDNDLLPW